MNVLTLKKPLGSLSTRFHWAYLQLARHKKCLSTLHQPCPPIKAYSELEVKDVEYFRSILGPEAILTGSANLEAYNIDWTRRFRGRSELVLRPKTTAEVSQVLAYCTSRNLAVVPQGGNTGLVGGGVPVENEIVLNLSRMNRIRSFDVQTGILIAEAGCVLDKLNIYLQNTKKDGNSKPHMMPVDLAASGSCMLGGLVATNAGGVRVLRYGSMLANTYGLEAVMADGRILDTLNPILLKNNTGLPLASLLVGSEGTLAVITAAAVRTPVAPIAVATALLRVSDTSEIAIIFDLAQRKLSETLAAFEFWDADSAMLVVKHMSVEDILGSCVTRGQNMGGPFSILVESAGGCQKAVSARIEEFLESVLELLPETIGLVAQDGRQTKQFWSMREHISDACTRSAGLSQQFKYDLSLPAGQMYDIVGQTRKRIEAADIKATHVVGFGHYGDGNIHLNVAVSSGEEERVGAVLEPFVYEWTALHGGSISAEHGIGRAKLKYLHLIKSAVAIDVMGEIKKCFDPKNILNPQKLYP